jgi:non-heme chloroperoxidase
MKTHRFFGWIIILFITLIQSATSQDWTDPSPHRIQFITVAPNVRLEVLDWGGKGKPLIFLTGLGNSAHIYDEYAPQFNDKFHVMAITRRGFGASSQPMSMNLRTWVDDIHAILDSLKIAKAILIGHSIAGDEMTKFASLYPARVEKLVYLDAAYDHPGIFRLLPYSPDPPLATASDSSSIERFQEYNIRMWPNARYPIAELYNILKLSSDGHIIGEVTPMSIAWGILDSVEHPSYEKIKSPALAIYAQNQTVNKAYLYFDLLDSTGKAKAINAFKYDTDYKEVCRRQFKNSVKSGQVITIMDADHYVFLSYPKETAIVIRKFLLDDK